MKRNFVRFTGSHAPANTLSVTISKRGALTLNRVDYDLPKRSTSISGPTSTSLASIPKHPTPSSSER